MSIGTGVVHLPLLRAERGHVPTPARSLSVHIVQRGSVSNGAGHLRAPAQAGVHRVGDPRVFLAAAASGMYLRAHLTNDKMWYGHGRETASGPMDSGSYKVQPLCEKQPRTGGSQHTKSCFPPERVHIDRCITLKNLCQSDMGSSSPPQPSLKVKPECTPRFVNG